MNTHDKIELPPNPISPTVAMLIDKEMGAGTADIMWQIMQGFARAAIEADRKQHFENGVALQRYKECGGDEESDPIERLRFYCSLAMSGQDWLDVEPFFDTLVADRQARGESVCESPINNKEVCGEQNVIHAPQEPEYYLYGDEFYWKCEPFINDHIRKHGEPLYTKPQPQQPRPTDDGLWDKTLRDRDHYHDMADKLAEAIAEHFGVDIGEHSSANCPWDMALEVIKSAPQPQQQVSTPIYQWRKRNSGPWHDAPKDDAFARIDDFYEARVLYPTPQPQQIPEGFCLDTGHRKRKHQTGEDCTCPKYVRHPECDRYEHRVFLPKENPWSSVAQPALQPQQISEYTSEMGKAGEAYLSRFKYPHPLPAQFSWSELWQVMREAAPEPSRAPVNNKEVCGEQNVIHAPQPQQQVSEPITEAIKRITDFIERRKQIRGIDQAEIMALDGCEYALLTEDLLAVCAAATQPQQIPEPSPLRESMSSNHRSYAEGWNACRKAMLEAAPEPKEKA